MLRNRPASRLLPDHLSELLISRREWGRRVATLIGAVLVGVIAILFAQAADLAHWLFLKIRSVDPLIPLVMTPAIFVGITLIQTRLAPEARGSGIP
ncbi:hypothetical protein [Croceicoccus marinus]|jgi:H+/Cl- antiporter ClcA|uniref:hypothetical protein n=1 Tax=Croceicoccus marinus TaxID=450378 RepID=UPI003144D7A4